LIVIEQLNVLVKTFFANGAKKTGCSPWGRMNQYKLFLSLFLDLSLDFLLRFYTAHCLCT